MESDALLLKKYVRSRDAEAFAALAHRYAGMVYGTALRILRNSHDAEEVAQICFLNLVRRPGSVRSSLGGWLHSLALSRAKDLAKKAERRERNEALMARTAEQRDSEPPWNEIAPLLDQAIADLPAEFRQPIVRHFLQQQSHARIAKALGVSRSTITRRIQAGVESLRDRFGKSGVALSAAALSALLVSEAASAAPATLTAAIGKMALIGSSAAGGTGTAAAGAAATASTTTAAGTAGGTATAAAATAATGGIGIVKLSLIGLAAATAVTVGVVAQQARKPDSVPPPAPQEQVAAPVPEPEPDPGPVATITGVVHVRNRKDPIPDARVLCLDYEIDYDRNRWKWFVADETRTDDQGRHKLSFPVKEGRQSPISCRLYAYKSPYAWHSYSFHVSGNDETGLYSGEQVIPLEMGASFDGRIVNKAGQPIENARIIPHMFDFDGCEDIDFLHARSDADGRFHFDGFPPQDGCRLVVRAGGYATLRETRYYPYSSEEPIKPFPVPGKDIQIVLIPESRISGRLFSEADGQPLSGRRLYLDCPGEQLWESTETDAEGRFAYEDLPARKCTIYLEPGRENGLLMSPVELTLAEGEHRQDLRLLVPPSFEVAGRVFDEKTGKPIPEIKIEVRRYHYSRASLNTTTDNEGRYRFKASEGRHGLHVWAQGEYARHPGVYFDVVGQPKLALEDIFLEKPHRIRFTLVDEENRPVAGAEIKGKPNTKTVRSDAEGIVDLVEADHGWWPGEHFFMTSANGARKGFYTLTRADEGTAFIERRIVLQPMGGITGTVEGPDGKPYSDAQAQAFWKPVSGLMMVHEKVQTDADGRYTLEGLIAGGRYTVLVHPAGSSGFGSAESDPVIIAPGRTLVAVNAITLPRCDRTLSIRFLDENDAPIPNLEFEVHSGIMRREELKTDATGWCTVEGLVYQDMVLELRSQSRRGFHVRVSKDWFPKVVVRMRGERHPELLHTDENPPGRTDNGKAP